MSKIEFRIRGKRWVLGYLLLVALVFMFSCRTRHNRNNEINFDPDTVSVNTVPISPDLEEDIIFYNLLYPIDMGKIIDKRTTIFNSTLLNPLNNINKYNTSAQKAIALGIYGADLSYLWIFDQSQQALSYFATIKQLADDLNIPLDYISSSSAKAENNTQSIDSLVSIARQAYYDSDKYLNENDHNDLAVLILLGGWVETMHIATHLYFEPHPKMAGKIISQKYSLTSLINLMYNQPSEQIIHDFMPEFNKLLDEFDNLGQNYLSDYIIVDTVKKTIIFNDVLDIEVEPNELDQIKSAIGTVRAKMIN